MTEKVNPSVNRPGNAHEAAVVIAQGGGMDSGWIVPATDVYLGDEDPDLNDGNFNAFDKVGENGLDVTIDAGEAFLHGAWVATDAQTVVTLPDNSTDETVYLGWDKDTSNGIIVGLSADFGGNDRKIPIWDFTTSGGAVDSQSDRRPIGKPLKITEEGGVRIDARLEPPTYATLSDVPTDMRQGAFAWVEDEQRYYFEDGN